MPLSTKQQQQIISLVGRDGLNRILARHQQTDSDATVIKALGIKYKSAMVTDISGFTPQQLRWVEMELGAEGLAAVKRAGSREKALQAINQLATSKKKQKANAADESGIDSVFLNFTDVTAAYKTSGAMTANSRTPLPGGTSSAIEQATPIIEDITQRLEAYRLMLGISPELHYYFVELLGQDTTEDVYRNASQAITAGQYSKSRRKALDASEQAALQAQQLEAMGAPMPVVEALGTVLKKMRYGHFIKRLMQVWEADQRTKPTSGDSTKTAIDPFFKTRVRI